MLRLLQYLRWKLKFTRMETHTRVAAAYARAAATAAARVIDPKAPHTWEFSGFSQHGEDGIIDYLCSKMVSSSRFFIEIGSANGMENCTSWLALARRFGGIMVEGNPESSAFCAEMLDSRTRNVQVIPRMVTLDNIESLLKACPHKDPDVFVIDIDSMDFHILKKVLELKYRPKLLVVEYNSSFGPEQAVTLPYQADFSLVQQQYPSKIYYGASIAAWSKLLSAHGYQFVTVESSGVNAFYIDPTAFPDGFTSGLRGTAFLENATFHNETTAARQDADGNWVTPKRYWADQFATIAHFPLVKV